MPFHGKITNQSLDGSVPQSAVWVFQGFLWSRGWQRRARAQHPAEVAAVPRTGGRELQAGSCRLSAEHRQRIALRPCSIVPHNSSPYPFVVCTCFALGDTTSHLNFWKRCVSVFAASCTHWLSYSPVLFTLKYLVNPRGKSRLLFIGYDLRFLAKSWLKMLNDIGGLDSLFINIWGTA